MGLEGVLAYFFYDSWIGMLFLLWIPVVMVYWQWQGWRRQVTLDIESGFKEWLYYVKSGIAAGQSIEHAILGCRESFLTHVGDKHFILSGLEQVYRGILLRLPLEECLYKFGRETGVEAIEDFAAVFEIAKKQGGHMIDTLERTIVQIYERVELRQELYAMIAAKKMEQRIMCVMPFGILFFVGRASGGYFAPLYHNFQGICIMTVCLVVYLLGVIWGEKMTEVRV